MQLKSKLRKKYFNLRKKKYYDIDKNFFLPLIKLIQFKIKKKNIKIALYYPSNFELNILKILELKYFLAQDILLPINKFGMLEPFKTKSKVPDLILIPTLAFDKEKFRLGYGKGFYDRYLNKYLKQNKDILTVGVAFSFQKHHKLPINHNDVKLDFILTEKGIF